MTGTDAPDHNDDGWAPVIDPPRAAVIEAVNRAIAEDVLALGDLTAGLVPLTRRATVDVVTRAYGVVAGRACAVEAFAQIDPELSVTWFLSDGSTVAPGDVIATVEGPLRSILTAERTALNFLCHLSGVATLTRAYVDAVRSANPCTRILDTRKTTPGLRALEKAAVRAGGGTNHRGSLSDAVLVKDNHLGGASIADAVDRARRQWPGRMIEVECDRLDQVREAVTAEATVVMLDNMGPDRVAEAVELIRGSGSKALIEVSGGVTLESAPALAAAGADLLSAGAITHSAPVLDIGLDLRG